MAGKVGIIWNTQTMFTRLVEDCGFIAELVTPHLLAAPFFRRKYSVLIVPGGFAHPDHCTVFSALRACEIRIQHFVRSGGTILVFGAGTDLPDAYGWLPCAVRYRFGFSTGEVMGCEVNAAESQSSCITEECPDTISIDGTLEIPDICICGVPGVYDARMNPEPFIHLSVRDNPVMIEYQAGDGRIILTTLHEYPSRRFVKGLCSSLSETLL